MRLAVCFVLVLLVLHTSAFDAENALDFAEGFAFGITFSLRLLFTQQPMRLAVCFVLVLLVLHTSAFDAENALDFAEGFAFGITDTITRNRTACTGDFVSMVEYFSQGFGELEKGLHVLKGSELVQGIKDVGHGIEKTGNLLVDCGVINTALHVTEIGYGIYQGEYISIVVGTVAAELLHKNHPITTNFKNAIHYWKEENFYESGKSTGEVVGLILAGTNPEAYAFFYQEGLAKISHIFKLTQKGTGTAWEWTEDTAGKVGEGAKDAAGKVADGAETAWDWTKETAGKVGEGAKDVAGKVADGGETALDTVKDVAGDVAKKVGGWFHF